MTMSDRLHERLRKRREEEIQRASKIIFESEKTQSLAPQINGKLRSFALRVPEEIKQCTGIVINGKRIRSLVFTTDVAIIRNVDADAVFAVYPYTPQPIITDMLVHAADIPVFAGVGGGLTKGLRVVNLAMYAEMQGAAGIVVNAPTDDDTIRLLHDTVDIPIIVTAVTSNGIEERISAGASIINVAGGFKTAEIIGEIRAKNASIPIIASGGDTDESVLATIRAGANAIVWTPPSNGEVFRAVMDAYREGKAHP